MADEPWPTLLRFHREILAPEIREIRGDLSEVRDRLDKIEGHIDAFNRRFGKAEVERQIHAMGPRRR